MKKNGVGVVFLYKKTILARIPYRLIRLDIIVLKYPDWTLNYYDKLAFWRDFCEFFNQF